MYNSVRERVLSDENIFFAVYLAHSYIQELDLLSDDDQVTLESLKDIFDKDTITEIVEQVKSRVKFVLDDDKEFFNISVFFKPKKRDGNTNVFRPIHTARLIDQIAMIAIAQILIFDCEKSDNGDDSIVIVPSEISRLIPSNFYGNRVSYDASALFKPWQEQYHEYTSTANEFLYKFSQTREYQYEVDLDLQNFFPSIDPQVLYGLVISVLPLNLSEKDRCTIKTILKKLLFFRLVDENGNSQTALNNEEWCWYLKEQHCPIEISQKVQEHGIIYAKGLPQGLPHTYYLANLMMLAIRDVYQQVVPGKMLFYVDDSVIFTNSLTGQDDDFDTQIKKINNKIRDVESKYRSVCKEETVYPEDYIYAPENYKITVHDSNGKSKYALICDANKNSGEVYLSGLCRETSTLSADLYFASSDEDKQALKSKTDAILSSVEKEIDRTKLDINQIYHEKLIRYKKFFKYRQTVLHYQSNGDLESLKKQLMDGIELRTTKSSEPIVEFFESYTDDILATLISFVLKKYQEAGRCIDPDLKKTLELLNKELYQENFRYSYLQRTCSHYYKERLKHCDSYGSLRQKVASTYEALKKQTFKLRQGKLLEIAQITQEKNSGQNDNLFELLHLHWLYKYSKIVRGNTENIEHSILNAIYSYILGYEINNTFIFSKNDRTTIQYNEIRILASLRNLRFSLSKFYEFYKECSKDEYCVTADYTLLQVLGLFKSCVILPERIDQLILIHKYCCDTWKNGSKFLYFYTLHNQEHAVTLIQNVRKILNSLSCFELKTVDYFILFAACYLHDISMVSFPDYSSFYTSDSESSNKILSDFTLQYDKNRDDPVRSKKVLCDVYQAIDSFFEGKVRGSHAFDSANEIRRFDELNFIEPSMRELIARVAVGHGRNLQEIYYKKSEGRETLISEKYDTILLRLSDLLDMSRYRISKVIFDHNLHNINPVSRFHWISHLLTDGYSLQVTYGMSSDINSNTECYIERKRINEKITLTVDVLMSQTTVVSNSKKCQSISSSQFEKNSSSNTAIVLKCDQGARCENDQCNFLCKWFTNKNDYLIDEVAALQTYLNSLDSNFYATEIEIRINVLRNDKIPNETFDYLREFIEQK